LDFQTAICHLKLARTKLYINANNRTVLKYMCVLARQTLANIIDPMSVILLRFFIRIHTELIKAVEQPKVDLYGNTSNRVRKSDPTVLPCPHPNNAVCAIALHRNWPQQYSCNQCDDYYRPDQPTDLYGHLFFSNFFKVTCGTIVIGNSGILQEFHIIFYRGITCGRYRLLQLIN